ncbi:DNA-3-methyladenine glycosylase I [Candidatus Obscuribacterales bacterium]|nr:DNA-3-methyladenine glycosylase I [Candidatus Obscuribacterales bacterium]MBX3137808.1 DNA-3-methyladenine glycosylase I [Candidatus Obscuribacterales bacterium]MBX3151293.1 DNA-3-methyladenine glycosylase I [Candidatus Obscuribacterales bacterium]
MAIPQQITPTRLNDYLEVITQAVFQAGVSWAQIDDRWEYYKKAFKDFDVETISSFEEADIERLMTEPNVMHSKKKIVATIKNARSILALDKAHGGFQNYLRSKKTYEELVADIRKRFSFLGEMSVYYFLFRVGEPVPEFEGWIKTIEGDHPRMREMVEAHKAKT